MGGSPQCDAVTTVVCTPGVWRLPRTGMVESVYADSTCPVSGAFAQQGFLPVNQCMTGNNLPGGSSSIKLNCTTAGAVATAYSNPGCSGVESVLYSFTAGCTPGVSGSPAVQVTCTSGAGAATLAGSVIALVLALLVSA